MIPKRDGLFHVCLSVAFFRILQGPVGSILQDIFHYDPVEVPVEDVLQGSGWMELRAVA